MSAEVSKTLDRSKDKAHMVPGSLMVVESAVSSAVLTLGGALGYILAIDMAP